MSENASDIPSPDSFIEDYQIQLSEIYTFSSLPGFGIAQTLRLIAKRLRVRVASHKNWGWECLHQVLSGKNHPGKDLIKAIENEYRFIKNKKGCVVFEEVTILAPVGLVPPKTILVHPSRTCSCGQVFIPNSPNHVKCPFCSKSTFNNYSKQE